MKLPAEQVPARSVPAHPDVLQLPWVPGEQGRGLGSSQPGSCHLHRPLSHTVQAQRAMQGLHATEILFSSHTYSE